MVIFFFMSYQTIIGGLDTTSLWKRKKSKLDQQQCQQDPQTAAHSPSETARELAWRSFDWQVKVPISESNGRGRVREALTVYTSKKTAIWLTVLQHGEDAEWAVRTFLFT